MTPPPMTTSDAGRRSRSSASVLVRYGTEAMPVIGGTAGGARGRGSPRQSGLIPLQPPQDRAMLWARPGRRDQGVPRSSRRFFGWIDRMGWPAATVGQNRSVALPPINPVGDEPNGSDGGGEHRGIDPADQAR